MNAHAADPAIFWHRELPPLAADAIGEHVIEASSSRVSSTLARRDELWAGVMRTSWSRLAPD